MKILNTVRPGALSHSIVPWCCCTNVCASVSPKPEPPSRPDTKGKKMRSSSYSGIPGPLSSICNSNAKRHRCLPTVTWRKARVRKRIRACP